MIHTGSSDSYRCLKIGLGSGSIKSWVEPARVFTRIGQGLLDPISQFDNLNFLNDFCYGMIGLNFWTWTLVRTSQKLFDNKTQLALILNLCRTRIGKSKVEKERRRDGKKRRWRRGRKYQFIQPLFAPIFCNLFFVETNFQLYILWNPRLL